MLADEVPYFLKKYFVKIATQRPLLSCEGVKTLKKHCRSPPPSQKPVLLYVYYNSGRRGEGGGGGRKATLLPEFVSHFRGQCCQIIFFLS